MIHKNFLIRKCVFRQLLVFYLKSMNLILSSNFLVVFLIPSSDQVRTLMGLVACGYEEGHQKVRNYALLRL
jgi:hypothetical protein